MTDQLRERIIKTLIENAEEPNDVRRGNFLTFNAEALVTDILTLIREEKVKMLKDFYNWNDKRDYIKEGSSSIGLTNQAILNLISKIESNDNTTNK